MRKLRVDELSEKSQKTQLDVEERVIGVQLGWRKNVKLSTSPSLEQQPSVSHRFTAIICDNMERRRNIVVAGERPHLLLLSKTSPPQLQLVNFFS
eukprot:scaffold836_cov189-Alexandrium_tamarense.AAC.26